MADPVLMPAPNAVMVLPQGTTVTGQLITELAEMDTLNGEERLVGVQDASGLPLGRALSVKVLREDAAREASRVAQEQTDVRVEDRLPALVPGAVEEALPALAQPYLDAVALSEEIALGAADMARDERIAAETAKALAGLQASAAAGQAERAVAAAEVASASAGGSATVATKAALNALTSIPGTDPPRPLYPLMPAEVLSERARYRRNATNDGWDYVGESSEAVAQQTRRLSSAAITLVEMEPFQVAGRWLQATSLTYPEVAVLSGYWLDTGESVYGQADLTPQVQALQSKAATLLQVEAFEVAGRWLQPLEVAIPSGAVTLGRWLDDGSLYPGVTGGAATGLPNVVVEVISSVQIRAHIRGQTVGSNKYICALLRNQVSTARNSDVWRADAYHESVRASDGSFTLGQELVKAGSENEFAVQGTNNSDGSGGSWSDLIGGIQHGNEEKFFVGFFLDGVPINPATGARYEGERFEIFQSTYGYKPGSSSGTKYVPKGAVVLHRHARWQYFRAEDGAKLLLTNRIEWKAPLWLFTAYLAMLGVQRWSDADPAGLVITNTGAREPYWLPEDMSFTGFPEVASRASDVKVWGPNGWAFEIRLIGQNRQYMNEDNALVSEGWIMPNRQFRFKNTAQYNKAYYNFAGNPEVTPKLGQSVENGDIWIANAEYTFTTRN